MADTTKLAGRDGWAEAMGFSLTKVSKDEVRGELHIDDRHRQPFGVVHGGVYCGIVETLCSVGAAANAIEDGQVALGVENHTSFLRGTTDGRLRGVAEPLQRGRSAHLWEAKIVDDQDRLVATGRLRVFCVDRDRAEKPASS